MPPPELIPPSKRLTVGIIFDLHQWMIHNDSNHRRHVCEQLGIKDPTPEQLSEHWYANGAAEFERTVVEMSRQKAQPPIA